MEGPHRADRLAARKRRTYTASHVVLAAGTYGTQKLLFKMRDNGQAAEAFGQARRADPNELGVDRRCRTFKVTHDLDLTHGVAITSSIHPTSDTHVEPVRYGKGSNAMGLLQTLMTDGAGPQGTDVPRWKQLFRQAITDPRGTLRLLNARRWSERTMIALVMQHLDNSITTFTQRTKLGFRRMTSKQGHGEPNPTWIPAGNEVTRRIAEKIDGVAGGTWGELFNIPLTAHFLGGAAIGDTAEHGVIDPYQRVYGYPTLSVHRRRLGFGESRCESVAFDHRAGRAGGVAVAQQGSGGPAPGPGRAVQAARADSAGASGRTGRCARRRCGNSDRACQFSGLTGRSTQRPTCGSGGCRLRAGMNLAVLS